MKPARSSRCVRTAKPGGSPPRHRRSVLKTSLGAVTVLATGFLAVTAVMAGVGRVLARSVDLHVELRAAITLTPPSDRLTWTSGLARGLVDEPQDFAARFAFETPVWNPMGALALAKPDAGKAADDSSVTGSLGKVAPKLAALDPKPVVLAPKPVVLAPKPVVLAPKPAALAPKPAALDAKPVAAPVPNLDAALTPLPPSRPKLAALTPPGDLGIKPPEQDVIDGRTAVYDITARLVYMPNGERLEAHSGFGDFMDNPRHVHRRMRGATPPNTYSLRLRESLFHGVRAIRMTPEREGDMFGRDGILAHSYLLGPNGQSHGCISFKDYPRFLRAYMRGEIDRIVVVARLAKPPVFARPNVRSVTNAL
jgi:hypothetical protein